KYVLQRAKKLAAFMRVEGFEGCTYEKYHELENSFMGFSIRHSRNTLPIISSAIFCALATRIGLRAYPCAFPYHVYTVVVDEKETFIYMDPFRNADEVLRDELESRLRDMGIPSTASNVDQYLRP